MVNNERFFKVPTVFLDLPLDRSVATNVEISTSVSVDFFLNRGNLPGFDKNVEFLWIFRNSWKLGKRGYLNGKTNKIETVPWEKWWKNIIRR